MLEKYHDIDLDKIDNIHHLRLDADLLIYGTVADELLYDYHKLFHVLDDGFTFEKYFRSDNFFIWGPPVDRKEKISEPRIRHLKEDILCGFLSDEMIEFYNKIYNLD